jgi:hypothetical protein
MGDVGHDGILLGALDEEAGRNAKKAATLSVAAFSKTLQLSGEISAGVGHGATHHRHGGDDGKLRSAGSE